MNVFAPDTYGFFTKFAKLLILLEPYDLPNRTNFVFLSVGKWEVRKGYQPSGSILINLLAGTF